MKLNVLFIILEYLGGFGFAAAGIFIFSQYDPFPLNTDIIVGFLFGFTCMFLGIVGVGYFHLKKLGIRNKFVSSILNALGGSFLSFLLCFLVANFLPYLGFIAFLIPLTGGVIGFNWALSKK